MYTLITTPRGRVANRMYVQTSPQMTDDMVPWPFTKETFPPSANCTPNKYDNPAICSNALYVAFTHVL